MDSISNFAESLILNEVNDITEGKAAMPSSNGEKLAPAGKDISKIEVPEDFMKEVLGESYTHTSSDEPTVDSIPELVWVDPEEKPEPAIISEETVQELIPLLHEVKSLLTEMMTMGATMSGNIGVNMAGPQKETSWGTEDYGYKKSKPSRKNVLKQAIKNKLKARKK